MIKWILGAVFVLYLVSEFWEGRQIQRTRYDVQAMRRKMEEEKDSEK